MPRDPRVTIVMDGVTRKIGRTVWYDEPTGEVFWRAAPEDQYDAARHKFRVATHAENKANLIATYDLIRRYRPRAAIVFTLSPAPLAATFRPVGPFVADTVSKAALRCAVDEVFRERSDDARLFYYPSYEVVRECFDHPFQDDLRHPQGHVLDLNMLAFERYFRRTGRSDAELEEAYLYALALDRRMGELSDAERHRWEAVVRVSRPARDAPSVEKLKALERRDERIAVRAARFALRDARLAERARRLAVKNARLQARAGTAAPKPAEP